MPPGLSALLFRTTILRAGVQWPFPLRHPCPEFDFELGIDPTPGNPLPTTLPDWIDEVDVIGKGGYVLAENLPHTPPFDYGFILVDFKNATLTPVPEPSTYGLAAVVFLGSLVVRGRRRLRRVEQA